MHSFYRKDRDTKPDMLLWLDSNRGVYIPQHFVESFKDFDAHVSDVSAEDKATLLSGPDSESYWDAWADVCDNATVTDENGIKYRIHHDGDLWLIPEGMEYNEETDTFDWPDE
jgi:hypothetical protein